MIKYLVIVFMLLALRITANDADTCRTKLTNPKFQQELSQAIFKSFAEKEFYSLAMFCNGYVDLTIIQNDEKFTESSTEYKTLQSVTNLFSQLTYVRFTLASGFNEKNVFIILATLYATDDKTGASINVGFITDHNGAITEIVIF